MRKILIIEDDTFLAEVLVKKLKEQGYEIEVVTDGIQGLAKMKSKKPHLLITDIQLPFVNGIEMLQQKIADSTIKSIPVFLLTNSIEATEGINLKDLGVVECALKATVSPEDVVEKVNKIMDTINKNEPTVASAGNILEGKKVMLVEDDTFLSNVLSRHITSKHAVVNPITTGESAIEAIKKEAPDIVVLDILLPGINGFEVLNFIRSNESTKGLPVIVASNFNQPEDRAKALGQGAKFLVKALVLPDDIIAEIIKSLAEAQK